MRNRFINLFIRESGFRLKIVIILIIVFILFWLGQKIQLKVNELVGLRREKARIEKLIAQVPQLEEKLKGLRSQPPEPQKINFVLSGIFIQNNIPVALIGENFYHRNDSLDGFIITKITSNSIILKDKSTGQAITLYLPE